MKCQDGFVLTVLVAVSCWAQDIILPPNFGEDPVLNTIVALTVTRSQTSTTALELLELVALGRTDAIRAAAETQVGLVPGTLKTPIFAQPSVRLKAIQHIGECGLPEALDFLKNLKRADLGEDTTQTLWPSARVTLRKALLGRIADPKAKTEFLVKTLTGEGDGTAYWAAQLLCDHGVSTALPLIRQLFRTAWSGPNGQEAITFCEMRMQVVSRDPDRVKALGSILTVDSTVSDQLLVWAVYQLNSVHSASSDAELDRFARELGTLREGSPQNGRLAYVREYLDRIRR
jgi:hypothetical protein